MSWFTILLIINIFPFYCMISNFLSEEEGEDFSYMGR